MKIEGLTPLANLYSRDDGWSCRRRRGDARCRRGRRGGGDGEAGEIASVSMGAIVRKSDFGPMRSASLMTIRRAAGDTFPDGETAAGVTISAPQKK